MKNIAVCMLACLLLLLSACGQGATLPPVSQTVTQSPANSTGGNAPTATLEPPAPTPTPVPTKPLSLDEQIQRVTLTAVQAVTVGSHATVAVYFGLVTETEMLDDCCARVDNIHIECFKLMQAIWHDSMSSHIVVVQIHLTANLVDQYGRPSIGDVGRCRLTSDTEKKFVWENLDQDSAWNVYDITWTLPGL